MPGSIRKNQSKMNNEAGLAWRRKTFVGVTLLCLLSLVLLAAIAPLLTSAHRQAISVRVRADAVTPPELVLQTGHSFRVNCSVFWPDGRSIASGSADTKVKIWDVATGRELRALTGHKGGINSLAIDREGKWLASGSQDLTIKVWDVVTAQ